MAFSGILSKFEIKELLIAENSILGQTGYLFLLDISVAYLYEETRGSGKGILFIDNQRFELSNKERDKIHSLIRLQRIRKRELKTNDLWVYSSAVEKAMRDLLNDRPDLKKGSAHMAFLPKNYTRFSENLLFDFDYIYNDIELTQKISNFEEIWKKRVNHLLPKEISPEVSTDTFSDESLYRYLVDKTKELRMSINGKITMAEFLVALFEYGLDHSSSRLCFNLGPELLFLRTDENLETVMVRKTDDKIRELENREYVIIHPNREILNEILEKIDIVNYT